jgi:hypothetical protein
MRSDLELELFSIQSEIDMCSHEMSESWVKVEPIPGQPGKAVRSLKPEFFKRHQELQLRIVHLQERRVEVERELAKEQIPS